jgi:membrane protease YdiL (CAAX protease family)
MGTSLTTGLPRSALALPVEPREYHSSYRTARFRWWHAAIALVGFALLWGAAVLAATIAAVVFEMTLGSATPEELADGLLTPALFLANNLGIALAIPAALVIHRGVFGQRSGWLFSVEGRFRWRPLRRFLLVAAAVHMVVLAGWLAANGPPDDLRFRPETSFLLAAVLLTTPLQAAGEEVAFRGLAARALGSCFSARLVGLVVATTVTTLMFVLVHGAADVRLNAFYFCLALAASVLTWRSGGLEAAIALHVVSNLTTMLFLPFLGLDGFFDRGAGAGGGEALAQIAAVVLTAAALLWQSRRIGIPRFGLSADAG